MPIIEKSSQQYIFIKDLPPHVGGGKAQGLRFLYDLGLNVPETLVLIGELEDKDEALQLFLSLEAEKLAVRSSSHFEDSEDHSAAGQYESKMNISSHSELIKAVRLCRNSGNNERVRKYNDFRGIGYTDKNESIPLVIQKMIDPAAAGVLFTMNPITGSCGHMLVEAAEGLGENVVDGKTETSSYKIDKNRDEVVCTGKAILSEKILKDLKSGATLAEKTVGHPLDLEWAVDKNGVLWWLQSRAVTTLDSNQLNSTILDDKWILTTGNIGEVFPGSITPLTYSTAGIALDVGMQKMYKSVGVPLKEEIKERYIHYYDNHLFFLMDNIWEMEPYVLGTSAEQMNMSIIGIDVERNGKVPPNKNVFLRALNLIRYMRLLLKPEKFLAEMHRMIETFHIPVVMEENRASELFNSLLHGQNQLNHMYFLHYIVSGHSALMNIMLNKTVKDQDKILAYMSDIPEIESALIPNALRDIAREILKIQNYKDFLILNPKDQLEWLQRESKLWNMWKSFISRHGHRSIKELEMREKEWAIMPSVILSNLSGIVRSMENTPMRDQDRPVLFYEEKLPKAALKAREGVRKRERSKSLLVRFQNKFKAGWRNLADLMVSSSLLDEADLIYFHTTEEIGILLNGTDEESISNICKKAAVRREKFKENDLLHFPILSHGRPIPRSGSEEGDSENKLMGIPVSKGIYTGVIRVVRTIEDAEALEPGDIMVSTFTDIGWSPYYSLCGALITELGSPLSHGAVVAREYGIPLVSSVKDATVLLKNGNVVRVDGTAGHIEIVQKEKS